jgi:hypothetical protein
MMDKIYILTPVLPSSSAQKKISKQLQAKFNKCSVAFQKSQYTFEVNVLNEDNKALHELSEQAYHFLLNILFQC